MIVCEMLCRAGRIESREEERRRRLDGERGEKEGKEERERKKEGRERRGGGDQRRAKGIGGERQYESYGI